LELDEAGFTIAMQEQNRSRAASEVSTEDWF
jgi:hypothetical protein